jgi:hypothetical protein
MGRQSYYTASFSSLAGRKAIFLLALILMVSPVAGFRPIRAARFRTWRIPRPVRRILSPFLRCRVVSVTGSPSTASACFFGRSWLSDKVAARCLSVTVACAAAFAGAAFAVAQRDRLKEALKFVRRGDTVVVDCSDPDLVQLILQCIKPRLSARLIVIRRAAADAYCPD